MLRWLPLAASWAHLPGPDTFTLFLANRYAFGFTLIHTDAYAHTYADCCTFRCANSIAHYLAHAGAHTGANDTSMRRRHTRM